MKTGHCISRTHALAIIFGSDNQKQDIKYQRPFSCRSNQPNLLPLFYHPLITYGFAMISVLYVDDDPTLLEVTQLLLERSGEFKVDLATSAADALKVPELLMYDAVVSDYLMPDMDGIGLLKEIRSRSADIPFILFTGRGMEDVVIEAINNGADFYLRKGGDPTAQFAELKHKIKKAVERKRAKDALMERAEQYRLLAENSPEMIYIVDANGYVRYANSVAARQFNAPPDAITGKHLSEIFPEPVAQQHLDVIRQVISSKKPIHHETQEETPAGAIWIDVHLAPIIGQTGTVVAVLGLSNDITDRKRAEAALLESEERFKTLFERSADAQLLLDAAGRVADCNAAFLALFALKDKDDVLGHSPDDFAPEYQPDGVRSTQRGKEIVQSVMMKGTVRYEWAHQKHDAARTPILTEVICTIITIARRPMIHASIRDITDRMRMEEALRRNGALYRTLVESTSDIVWEVDKDGRYSYVSPVIVTVLGFEPDEVIGRTPFDLMPQGEAERIRTAFSECLAARRPIVRLENTNIHKDGHRVILETSGEPVFDPAGTLTGYRGIDRDITERKRAEEALRETNKKLNLLSSITRHDVLNKLTALQGFIDLSKECFSGDETFRSFADKELLAVSEIQRIISFTKEYEEIGVRSPEWQDIRDVLRRAAGWLDWNGVNLRIEVSGYMVYADPLLEKVFYNLLDNSLRHGQTVTALQISVSETANGLVIVCQDNGTGITAGEKEKIFGRGYGRHSGFGLFLAREILGITGISIRETGQPGEGARFEILAPRGVYHAPG